MLNSYIMYWYVLLPIDVTKHSFLGSLFYLFCVSEDSKGLGRVLCVPSMSAMWMTLLLICKVMGPVYLYCSLIWSICLTHEQEHGPELDSQNPATGCSEETANYKFVTAFFTENGTFWYLICKHNNIGFKCPVGNCL